MDYSQKFATVDAWIINIVFFFFLSMHTPSVRPCIYSLSITIAQWTLLSFYFPFNHYKHINLLLGSVFRLGNTLSSVDAAMKALLLTDPVLRFCLTTANLNRALYFICDNVLWARSISLIRDVDKERWSRSATRYYFFSLVMNLVQDTYMIARLMLQKTRDGRYQQKVDHHLSESQDAAPVIIPQLDAFLFLLIESLRSHPGLVLDVLKNACDLFIPLDKLGVYRTNEGVIGLCGLVSSLLGILLVLKPGLKNKPWIGSKPGQEARLNAKYM